MPFLPQPHRADRAQQIRVNAAQRERARPLPAQTPNTDETTYSDPNQDTYLMGSYSKGLPHDAFGKVDHAAYKSLVDACASGSAKDFAMVQLGAPAGQVVKLVNPQAGLAYDLEGADAHALRLPPSPEVRSPVRAAEMIELYWMALCRDVPFTQYGAEPLTTAAIADLNKLGADFQGPKQAGKVTAQTLFRGITPGEVTGPYISQFFLQAAGFGALAVNGPDGKPAQQYNTYVPGVDYMTTEAAWRAVQNGQASVVPVPPGGFFGANQPAASPSYLKDGRGGSAFVHVDELYQAYFMAALDLLDHLMPNSYDVNNPYNTSTTQAGFGTFGNPHIATLVAEVATRALKAQWFQKWFVHRTLRPEAYGGLVHFQKTNQRHYGLPDSIMNSDVLPRIFQKNGNSYLLPQAFPEGSPQHPSYGSGHATVAGACATIIKAYFNETLPVGSPVVSSPDGSMLPAYNGPGFDQLNVMGEANKIAGNVGVFRMHAGVHWRSDHQQSILLGEQVGIRILEDQKELYNEPFKGWSFTDFSGEMRLVGANI